MGTRSYVGVMVGDKCRAVYVHWDGYLEGVGAELQEYTTQAKVEELISHGDRSSLTEGFYKDRGETDVDPQVFDTFNEFFITCQDAWSEWYYIFKDGVWYCGTIHEHSNLYATLTPYNEAVKIYDAEPETA
jgi:hypothetical protein